MRPLCGLLVCAAFLAGGPAGAQVLDLSTIKCKDFVASSKDEIGIILSWLDAYYKDEDDPPVINFAQLKTNGEKLGAYCGANPEVGLITASDSLFGK